MGWKEIVCEGIDIVRDSGLLEAGGELAVIPLTAVLAELGPLAPFVAQAIIWIVGEIGGAIADWACDESEEKELLERALAHARRVLGVTARTPQELLAEYAAQLAGDVRAVKSREAIALHPVDAPALLIPPRPAAAKILAGDAVTPIPISPVYSGPAPYTLFTPQPIARPTIGIATWPRMDDAAAKKYNQWARYEGTWNGQPHATYPKVGW